MIVGSPSADWRSKKDVVMARIIEFYVPTSFQKKKDCPLEIRNLSSSQWIGQQELFEPDGRGNANADY